MRQKKWQNHLTFAFSTTSMEIVDEWSFETISEENNLYSASYLEYKDSSLYKGTPKFNNSLADEEEMDAGPEKNPLYTNKWKKISNQLNENQESIEEVDDDDEEIIKRTRVDKIFYAQKEEEE